MASAREFSLGLDQFYRDLEGKVVEVEQDIAFELHEKLTRKTPVDTGLAASSWIPSVGEPDFTVPASAGAANVQAGLAAVAAMSRPETIYIQSNVPYIEALEAGHSAQAPNGMVALSVAEIETKYGGG